MYNKSKNCLKIEKDLPTIKKIFQEFLEKAKIKKPSVRSTLGYDSILPLLTWVIPIDYLIQGFHTVERCLQDFHKLHQIIRTREYLGTQLKGKLIDALLFLIFSNNYNNFPNICSYRRNNNNDEFVLKREESIYIEGDCGKKAIVPTISEKVNKSRAKSRNECSLDSSIQRKMNRGKENNAKPLVKKKQVFSTYKEKDKKCQKNPKGIIDSPSVSPQNPSSSNINEYMDCLFKINPPRLASPMHDSHFSPNRFLLSPVGVKNEEKFLKKRTYNELDASISSEIKNHTLSRKKKNPDSSFHKESTFLNHESFQDINLPNLSIDNDFDVVMKKDTDHDQQLPILISTPQLSGGEKDKEIINKLINLFSGTVTEDTLTSLRNLVSISEETISMIREYLIDKKNPPDGKEYIQLYVSEKKRIFLKVDSQKRKFSLIEKKIGVNSSVVE